MTLIIGRKIRQMVQHLIETTGIDLNNGAGIPELTKVQELFDEYKIVLYAGLNFSSVMFQGQLQTDKRIKILFDEVTLITLSLTR